MDHHRQEEVWDTRGRLWVNDSKATNVDASVQAINAYDDKPIHLILGGDDKGVDLNAFLDMIATKNITIYAVGSNADRLSQMSNGRDIACNTCYHLEDAVALIDTKLGDDEVALLSPAASSLDQFPSYAKRGELFMKLVSDLSDA